MKHVFILFLLFWSVASCSDNNDSVDAESSKYAVNVKDDIGHFNIATGELVLRSGQIVSESLSSIESFQSKIGLFSTTTFYLDGSSVFESIPMQLQYSSLVHNDLVLVIIDTKYYLLDGYPSLESLGANKVESEKVRNENFEKRKANWTKFLNYLRDAGKIVE